MGPSTGAAIRINKKLLPQMADSKIRLDRSRVFMGASSVNAVS